MIRRWGKQKGNQKNSEIFRNNLKDFKEYTRDFGVPQFRLDKM